MSPIERSVLSVVNAIRFAFHPPHPYMLNLCDRYGIFCLEELPVWNAPGDIVGSDSYQVVVDGMIREMVQRDQANPSIIAWGIGNDFDSARTFLKKQVMKKTYRK